MILLVENKSFFQWCADGCMERGIVEHNFALSIMSTSSVFCELSIFIECTISESRIVEGIYKSPIDANLRYPTT